MGPTWVLLPPDGPHVGPMNLAIRGVRLFRNVIQYVTRLKMFVELEVPWGLVDFFFLRTIYYVETSCDVQFDGFLVSCCPSTNKGYSFVVVYLSSLSHRIMYQTPIKFEPRFLLTSPLVDCPILTLLLGHVSISDKTSFCTIFQKLEVARFVFRIAQSFWNLSGTSAAKRCDDSIYQSLGLKTSRDLTITRFFSDI